MTRARRSAGFTLLEVMIALSLLFAALVILIRASTANVRAAQHVKMVTIATELARGKMLDVEEELLHDGFQDMVETMDGDFGDEGYGHITWDATIEKVELPNVNQMQDEAKDGQKDKDGDKDTSGSGFSAVEGLLGGPGMDAASTAGATMIMSQFEMIKQVLESAIRKVTLTVRWKEAGKEESFQVVCYFTDPKAVDSAFGPHS